MIERFSELRVFGGVFGGKARDAAGGFGMIVVKEESFAVGFGREEARIGMQHVAFVVFELQVGGDIGAKRTDGVRECGGAGAGVRFFSDGAATDEFAALEDERLEATFGEVEGGD